MTTIDIDDGIRVFKLRDYRERIKYIISLITIKNDRESVYDVTVKNVSRKEFPVEIIRERYDNYDYALQSFHRLIDDYSALIKTESEEEVTPDVLFKDSVNYHIVVPEICRNCEFSRHVPCKEIGEHPTNIICINKKNMRNLEKITIDCKKDEPKSFAHSEHAYVDENGTCKNYHEKFTTHQSS